MSEIDMSNIKSMFNGFVSGILAGNMNNRHIRHLAPGTPPRIVLATKLRLYMTVKMPIYGQLFTILSVRHMPLDQADLNHIRDLRSPHML